jgi:hypothetical protein
MIFGARELARRRLELADRSARSRHALLAASAPVLAKAAAAERLLVAIRTSLPWIGRALALYTVLKRRRGHSQPQ